jgi:hypothetical protein
MKNLGNPIRLINLIIDVYNGTDDRIWKNSKASRLIKLNISVKQGYISSLCYSIFSLIK